MSIPLILNLKWNIYNNVLDFRRCVASFPEGFEKKWNGVPLKFKKTEL